MACITVGKQSPVCVQRCAFGHWAQARGSPLTLCEAGRRRIWDWRRRSLPVKLLEFVSLGQVYDMHQAGKHCMRLSADAMRRAGTQEPAFHFGGQGRYQYGGGFHPPPQQVIG